MDANKLSEACQREIEDLHAFFVGWFRGTLPDTEEAWARAAQVMAPAFSLIAPSGARSSRAELLPALRALHGSRANEVFEIWTKNFELVLVGADQISARYEEWQRIGEAVRSRISSAIFVRDADAPHGVAWLAVHETWLPLNDDG